MRIPQTTDGDSWLSRKLGPRLIWLLEEVCLSRGDAESRNKGRIEAVEAHGDASEVLETAKRALDDVAPFVGDGIEGERLLPVFSVGNDHAAAAFRKPVAEFLAVVSGIGDHAQIGRQPVQHGPRRNDIVTMAAREADDAWTSVGVGDQMDLGIAPASA